MLETADELLAGGGVFFARDGSGETAADVAIRDSHPALAKMLTSPRRQAGNRLPNPTSEAVG